jgi:hypothetical protein
MTAFAARVWLPLGLSLAMHALFGLAVLLLPTGDGARAGGPVPIDTCVLADGGGTIIFDESAGTGKGRRGAAKPAPQPLDDESLELARTATVADLQVVTPVPVPVGPPEGSGDPVAPANGGTQGTGGAGTGGGSGIGLLRAPAAARSVVYVIDRSTSMGTGGALPVAKRELLAGINALPADARFAVILYNRQAEPLALGGQSGLVPATATNRAEAARLVDATPASGATDHLAALRRAVGLGAEVIFFVTDADQLDADQVRNVTLLNRGRAVIHTIELSNEPDGPDEPRLKLLARLNGGTYRVVAVRR